MKKIQVLLFLLVILVSCKKSIDVKDVNFDVTTQNVTYKVNDTVLFKFEGNPDNISFYSGQFGNNYDYINRVEIPISEVRPELSFTSYRQFGNSLNTLKVLISTDFNGKYDSANIYAANWIDITNRANLSTGTDNTPSGTINLADLNLNSAFYIAFKYNDIMQPLSAQRTWTIKNFYINSVVLANGVSINVADILTASWTGVSIKNSTKVWTFSSSQMQMAGGPANTDDNEDWAISKPIYLNKVNPDIAIALKNTSTFLSSFAYQYRTVGSYKAVFVASNTSKDAIKEVVKILNISVVP